MKKLALIVLTIILTGFITLLLYSNYQYQSELREFVLEQVQQDGEKRAIALSHFFSECKKDLSHPSLHREISIFFKNRALGMSMEYGLRASLVAINDRFAQLIEDRKLSNQIIYNRIAFFDRDGKLLVDRPAAIERINLEPDPSPPLLTNSQIAEIIDQYEGGVWRIIISVPFFFKGTFSGQIVSWIYPQTIYDHLINMTSKYSKRQNYIVSKKDYFQFPGQSLVAGIQIDPPNLARIPIDKPSHFKGTSKENSEIDLTAIRIPVESTPFSLVTILPSSEVFPHTAPKILLLLMGTLAFSLIGSLGVIYRGYTRNLQLRARLDESSKREKEIQEKKQQLEKEIEERKRAEESQKQILQTNKEILASMPFGVIIVGKDKKIRMANKSSLNLIGLDSEDEILGKICHNKICPAEVNQCPIIDLGQNVDSLEKKLLDRNGKSIPILKTVLPVNLEGEDVLLEAFVDISNLKATEAALTRAKVAEQASQAKSGFLANMSHELRTPLNHIIGFTEIVVDKKCGDLNETQTEYLKDVLQSSSHLLSLINDILDLSKVEAGKMELSLGEVHLENLLSSSLLMVKEKAQKHRIQLSRDLNGCPEKIQADERKLKQILYNLLSNAVKFTPEGGSVRVGVCRVNEISSGKGVEFSVTDTGIGIKPEDQERIFAPFEQVENSSSRRYQGTGLGLSLTKRLVELHGGQIWVESEGEGKGTKFSFIIPT